MKRVLGSNLTAQSPSKSVGLNFDDLAVFGLYAGQRVDEVAMGEDCGVSGCIITQSFRKLISTFLQYVVGFNCDAPVIGHIPVPPVIWEMSKI